MRGLRKTDRLIVALCVTPPMLILLAYFYPQVSKYPAWPDAARIAAENLFFVFLAFAAAWFCRSRVA